jgi:hypothetical protein
MRGRAVTENEFQRILEATASVARDQAAPSWQFADWIRDIRSPTTGRLPTLLGRRQRLRRRLQWRRPMFIIRGALEERKRDRLLPMAPEFAHLLDEVRLAHREGRLFQPQSKRPGGPTPQQRRVVKR